MKEDGNGEFYTFDRAYFDNNQKGYFLIYLSRENLLMLIILQALERVLRETARTFPSEMLLQQRNPPSSSSLSPELTNLQGVGFAIFSEIDKDRKIDAAKVKNFCGRDTIPYRGTVLQCRSCN